MPPITEDELYSRKSLNFKKKPSNLRCDIELSKSNDFIDKKDWFLNKKDNSYVKILNKQIK